MTRTYQISVVLLSAAVLFSMASPKSVFAQRVRSGGESNQGNKEKKKDKDDDEHKDKKDKKDQNNQGQGGNQGGNQPNQNPPNNNQGANQNNQDNNQNKQGDKKNEQDNKQGGTPRNFSPNQGKSGNANNSGNSNVPSQFQPFIQGGKNQSDKDKKDSQGQNNQGQGGSNRVFNPADRQGFPGNSQNQQVIGGGGNAESANRRLGRWKGDQWDGTRKVDNWSRVFGVKDQPFSSKWYDDHPSAWKYNNNKANVWVVASVPGVYSWLGWGNVPAQPGVNYGPVERFDPSYYGDWYPLGVYSLMSGEEDPGTRVVQLAVDRHGHINGNYFDMITSANNAILGEVDRNTQRVEFWLNRNPSVRFRASIGRLLQPYGSLTVQLPGGDQRWQFVRLEN